MPMTAEKIKGDCWLVRSGDEHFKYGDPYDKSLLLSKDEAGWVEIKGMVSRNPAKETKALKELLKGLGIEKVFFLRRVEWILK